MTRYARCSAACVAAVLAASGAKAEVQYRGSVATELRLFTEKSVYAEQSDEQLSLALEPDIYFSWNGGQDSLTVRPFVRLDNRDDERQHADLREFLWTHASGAWELHAGVGKVFWGVTESQHLVDVINQTDLVEAVDGEEKLGQPMVHYSYVTDWGVLDAVFLPYFRERTFPSRTGRVRTPLPASDDEVRYESDAKRNHRDYAVRFSTFLRDWEVGLSYFDGTDREPRLLMESDVLVPFYVQTEQIALDLQAGVGNALWKLEAVHRNTTPQSYWALTAGLEYTQVGVFDSYRDLGLLVEYLYDDRGSLSTTPGQNDLFLGSRLMFNNAKGTEMLFGLTQDLDHSDTRYALLEVSSRINSNWKWYLEAWAFQSDTPADSSYWLRNDDYFQFTLSYYF